MRFRMHAKKAIHQLFLSVADVYKCRSKISLALDNLQNLKGFHKS